MATFAKKGHLLLAYVTMMMMMIILLQSVRADTAAGKF